MVQRFCKRRKAKKRSKIMEKNSANGKKYF